MLTDTQLDEHLDAVLKASGSGLRYYSMQVTKDRMRAAMRAFEREVIASPAITPPLNTGSPEYGP